jgi:superfamily II DNA or RNA helicase
VLVNSTHIAAQWAMRARDHLGIKAGIVGDNQWQEEDLTIALVQTLWRRHEQLDEWWDGWGMMILDECHHAPADTFYNVVQQFPAYYREGLSATPLKQEGREKVVTACLGPIVHSTPRAKLVDVGAIVNPIVKILPTSFKTTFWPTHAMEKDPETGMATCDYADVCTRRGFRHGNNYSEVIKKLVRDDVRNEVIGREILRSYSEGRAVLVISMQLKHLDFLANAAIGAGVPREDIYRLSGKEKTKERMALYERADEGGLVIFSTVADEALDIPRLDTMVLAFPGRQEGLIDQRIGRIARTHDEKAVPELIDVSDDMKVLDSQLKARMRVYRRHSLRIEIC